MTHSYEGLGRLVRDGNGALRPLDDVLDSVGNRRRSSPVTDDGTGGTTTATTTFAVNLLDQVIAETRSEGTTSRTSKVTYDAAGNAVDRCRWDAGATVGSCLPVGTTPWDNPPSQASTSRSDALNQRIELTDGRTEQTTVYSPDDNYQPAAVYTPVATAAELQTLYRYDERQRLTSLVTQRCTISAGHECSATEPLGSST